MAALSARTLATFAERVTIPTYDRDRVTASVVHVGVGGFHRSHQAAYHERLLAGGGPLDAGICGVGVLPSDRRMHEAMLAQDCLYTLVVKHADGTVEPRVIGSIVDFLFAPDDPEAVIERLASEATRVISLTITEGGYNVGADGVFDVGEPAVARDLAEPGAPHTVYGLVVEALRRRRERGIGPPMVMSCDNLIANGAVARAAFGGFARGRDPELGAWIERSVAFPSSVVDRITPATADVDRAALAELYGIEDRVPVVCEPFRQWVLERTGAPGLPPYEDVGVRFVDDERPYELMKLRLLNAGHQLLAWSGLLCEHRFVHDAVLDPEVGAFLVAYLDEEAMPTLTGVPRSELDAFRGPLLGRFANRAIADTLERVAADASDRIPKFILPVVRDRLASGGDVRRSAAVIAAWARTLAGPAGALLADRRLGSLAARARRGREDPGAFLEDREVFGDLADHEAFAAPYRAAVGALEAGGARATFASLG